MNVQPRIAWWAVAIALIALVGLSLAPPVLLGPTAPEPASSAAAVPAVQGLTVQLSEPGVGTISVPYSVSTSISSPIVSSSVAAFHSSAPPASGRSTGHELLGNPPGATATIAPVSGPANTNVTLTVSGFTPLTTFDTYFDNTEGTMSTFSAGSFTTDLSGDFSGNFSVPAGTSGAYYVDFFATGVYFGTVTTPASGQFTVTTPSLALTPLQGPIGANVSVVASGFAPSTHYDLYFDTTQGSISTGVEQRSFLTDGVGGFSGYFDVSGVSVGTYFPDVFEEVSQNYVGSSASSFQVTPVAIAIFPDQGPIGASYSVNGTGFSVSSSANVTFNAIDQTPTACSAGTFSGTSITTNSTGAFACNFTVPSLAAGPYSIVGNDVATGLATTAATFTITTPAITVVPSKGSLGSPVTVSGSGFSLYTPLASLVFDGVTISSCTTGSLIADGSGDFSCGFAVPAGTSGTAVVATDADGQTATGTFTLTTPAISLAPIQGPTGTSVLVSGTEFVAGATITTSITAGASITSCGATVTGSGTFSCSVTITSSTPVTYTVTATGSDGSYDSASAPFTVTAPSISLSPTQGPSSASVTVSGTGFSIGVTVTTTIGSGATITSCGATVSATGTFSCTVTITSTTPATYTVTAKGSDSATVPADKATAPYIVTAPALTLTPTQGPSGVSVALSGAGFTPGATITASISSGAGISGCTATVSGTGTFSCTATITSSTPAGYTVTATGSDGSFDSATAAFTVTHPAISLAPTRGPSGASTTISGTGFTPGATVASSIGSGATIGACGATVAATGTFSCTVAITSSTPAAYTVTATGSDGAFDKSTATFTVTTTSITLTPAQGPSGATTTVSGSGFTPGVTITTTIATGASITSCGATTSGTGAFSCSATITSAAPAGYRVTATGSDGSFDSAFASFTVTLPSISLSPDQGPSGASTTVTGSGFSPSVTITTTISSGGTVTSCGATTSATGTFTCTVTITSTAPAGYTVTATGSDGSFDAASATFTTTTPTIALAPTQGPSGVSVTVSGTGFTPGRTVTTTIGTGATITSCGATVSATGTFSCTVTISSGTPATYIVTATGSDGSFDAATATFKVTAPAITISPTQGPSGASVTVTGTGFTPGATITASISAGATITGCSATVSATGTFSCSATITSSTPASYTVTATGSDGGNDHASTAYSVTAPAITVAPGQGPSGVSVTISGTGFTPGATITAAITAGASVTGCSATVSGTGTFSCTAIISGTASGIPYTLSATGSDGAFDRATAPFTITTPAISLSPTQGPSGATVTISGTGFTPGATITASISAGATIAGCSGTVSATGTFSCTATVSSATPAGYTVTASGSDGGGDHASATFTVTAPTITLSPAQGPSGASFTVSGTGFTPGKTITTTVGSGATVTTCGATVSATGTFSCTVTITSSTPATYTVTATGSDGGFDSGTASFTVTAPTISLAPTQGPSGASVTISGTGFTPGKTVTASIGSGASVSSCGATVTASGTFSCSVTITSTTPGTYSVTATGSDGSFDSASASFKVTTPGITLTPSRGSSGTLVTIAGNGFTPGTTITASISTGATISSCGATVAATGTFSCVVTISSSTPAGYTVTATGSDGSFDKATATFTVTSSAITVAPTQGPSGVTVTVSGTGFTPGVTVTTTISSGASITSCGATVSGSGTFTCLVTITGSASTTPYTVTATGSDGGNDYTEAAFTITTPTVTLTPDRGPSGVSVTVAGTGFTPGATITTTISTGASIGTCSATVTGTGTFSCSVTISSSTAGGYTVTATGSDGSFDVGTATFTVTSPAITLTPSQGPSGAAITVSGTGFTPGATITTTIGSGATITSCGATVTAGGTFSCVVTITSGTPGAYSVTATGSDMGNDHASATFTISTPAISIAPAQGPVGASFTVSGTGFSPSGAATVSFNGVHETPTGCTVGTFSGVTITTNDDGAFSCTFTVPSVAAGPYNVVGTDVPTSSTTPARTFTVTTPSITITPGQGPRGATVTVSGTGFSVSTALASLVFDGVGVSSCSGGSLATGATGAFSCTFSVPPGTSGTTVLATDVGGRTASTAFTVTAPSILVAPGQGPVGATVTVTGNGFSVTSALASLVFDGVAISSCTSGGLTTNATGGFTCTFAVPAATTGTAVIATDPGGTTASGAFTVTTPTLTVTPGQGPKGAVVTVTGSGFSVSNPISSLVFDGVTIASCSTGSLSTDASGAFSCTFTVPGGTSGTSVVATDVGGQMASGAFTVTIPGISLSIGQGPSGVSVTVSGTGFTPGRTITTAIGTGASITTCAATVSATGTFSCSVTISTSTPAVYSLTATGSDGTFDSASAMFTVTTPTISVGPGQGPSGVSVRISGTGFTPGALVTATIGSGATITSCGATVGATGTFSCSVTITSTTANSYTVAVTGADGSFDSATAPFSITAPAITISPTSASPGGTYTVTGAGFSVSSTVTVAFDSAAQAPTSCSVGTFSGTTITTDAQGAFDCTFAVPNVGSGSYNIVGTDTATSASASSPSVFTVTSSSSTPFPWWIVILVIVVLIVLILALLLVRQRRKRESSVPAGVHPWQGSTPPAGASAPGATAVAAAGPAVPEYLETPEDATPSSAAPPRAPGEGEPDIDSLMAELDKISGEILKRTPKKDDAAGGGGDAAADQQG
jgi:hypothetical protein